MDGLEVLSEKFECNICHETMPVMFHPFNIRNPSEKAYFWYTHLGYEIKSSWNFAYISRTQYRSDFCREAHESVPKPHPEQEAMKKLLVQLGLA